MADVTGRAYESLTAHLLEAWIMRRPSTKRKHLAYSFEKHFTPTCFTGCAYADQCQRLSSEANLPFGPWNDPDFVITWDDQPVACLHVAHWSSPTDSSRKFWRSMEDQFQWKTLYGGKVSSISFLFEGLPEGLSPRAITGLHEPIELHGWNRGIGSLYVTSFDASIVFPIDYAPLLHYSRASANIREKNPDKRRQKELALWMELCEDDEAIREELGAVVATLDQTLAANSGGPITDSLIKHLRKTCFEGRKSAIGIKPTETRYRKGIQHLFILTEVCKRRLQVSDDALDLACGLILSRPRIPTKTFFEFFENMGGKDNAIKFLLDHLGSIPVKIDKGKVTGLLNPKAGIGQISLNQDLEAFGLGLRQLDKENLKKLKIAIRDLFSNYLNARGISDVLDDLADEQRIVRKISFAENWLKQATEEAEFEELLLKEVPLLNIDPTHQVCLREESFWLIDAVFSIYDIKRKQDLLAYLPGLFLASTGEPIRGYSFRGSFDQTLNFVLQGGDLSGFYPKKGKLSQKEFLKVVWPLIAKLLWRKMRLGAVRTGNAAVLDYTYRKARRIISQSDLEPNVFLIHRAMPRLKALNPQRGAFSVLGAQKGWGSNLLTTEVVGLDTDEDAIIHSQSVVGQKHILDKTRELAARVRSLTLEAGVDGKLVAPAKSGLHVAVVDGDWPIHAKLNLLEAGFAKVVEIGHLDFSGG